jgi:phage gp29-like protein
MRRTRIAKLFENLDHARLMALLLRAMWASDEGREYVTRLLTA